jgi:hypothetical protein
MLSSPAKPIQREFDLKLPSNRPLLPMKAAICFLDRDEKQIMNLIDLGLLMWAFDIRRRDSVERREVRIWRKSLIDYAQGIVPQDGWRNLRAQPNTKDEWNEVVKGILPGKATLRGYEIARVFTCSKMHVIRLADDGDLVRSQPATKPKESPYIKRESIVTFLSARRIH